MNMLDAMHDTLALMRERGCDNIDSEEEGMSYTHLVSMYERASVGNFSEGKLGRWLGWMQATAVFISCGDLTLEDMKQINKRNS